MSAASHNLSKGRVRLDAVQMAAVHSSVGRNNMRMRTEANGDRRKQQGGSGGQEGPNSQG